MLSKISKSFLKAEKVWKNEKPEMEVSSKHSCFKKPILAFEFWPSVIITAFAQISSVA